MQFVFWHNLISPHQSPFMRVLADSGHDVLVVATEDMSEGRRSMGWSTPALGGARIVLGPSETEVRKLVASSTPDSIHVIAGARGTLLGRQVALACRASGRQMGLVSESPDPRGLGGPLRWVKYSWERITMGNHFDFILAMGQRGVRWFKFCGYPDSRIFPFAYVTDRNSGNSGDNSSKAFRFVFVGQLIPRKGVDLLLRALAQVASAELSVVGDGPERPGLEKLALECGIADRVFWHGSLDAAQAQARIHDADAFILPSREDGWGAVVNEALMAGTPAICSTACGAADLIRYPWLGTVFKSGNMPDLAAALRDWVSKGKVSEVERERIRSWARSIEAPVVAKYFELVMNHVYQGGPRPAAPWRQTTARAANS